MTEAFFPAPPDLDTAAVRGLVFDLDGTLIDSYDAIAESLNHARGRFGLATLDSAAVRRVVGRGLENLIAEQIGHEHVEEGVRLFREHYAKVCLEMTRALPGVGPTLAELHRRGYAMAVASNKPARFSTPILRELGLLDHLITVQGPDRAGTTKPEPTMLLHCLRSMGLQPSQALYVGDMVLDVESAARAGLPVVLVCGGSSPPEALHGTGQRVLRSFAELTELLG